MCTNSWSDVTGKHKRNREHIKLLSSHWHWISDWMIDFHTPGGVDSLGWQYAMDFPSLYHAKKNFTDYVRRRRWYRKAKLTISGPWQEIGNTKIVDVSLYNKELTNIVIVWAISASGEILTRQYIDTMDNRNIWEHIATEMQMISISVGPDYQVWTVGKNGAVYRRKGITSENLTGESWQKIDSSGINFKQLSYGKGGCWGIDNLGKLYCRKDISSVFPEGKYLYFLIKNPASPGFSP